MDRYERDMIGYGKNIPKAKWPNEAKIAVQFVINYEEGGENCILHGDGASEAFLSEIIGAAPWPNQRHWNMESIYEYGARAGFWRLHRLFTKMKIPVTVYGVASALARSPEQVKAMQDAGWEIASHGLKWIEHKDMLPADEKAQIQEAINLHQQITGERPYGWYTGRCSDNTVRLVSNEGGFDYISDSYADDLPYWLNIDGHDQLIIPYTLDTNDMRFATAQGFSTSGQFFDYLRDTFDTLYSEGVEGSPKMMSIGLHCRLIGRPGRITAIKRFIEHAASFKDVWFAKRIEIAKHWQRHHPPKSFEKPSKMAQEKFVETFGGIFEKSPWIAKKTWDTELGPAYDTVEGLHSAFCRIFRAEEKEIRLEVLRAHPDLAVKLSKTEQLTKESQNEQASAGLNNLTSEEYEQFNELNRSYREKYGFPFIIAVKNRSKSEILDKFISRIKNTQEMEFNEACAQVERIAEIRLMDII